MPIYFIRYQRSIGCSGGFGRVADDRDRNKNGERTDLSKKKRENGQKPISPFWLPDQDSNPNIQSQNLLYYHYTIGQRHLLHKEQGTRNR